LQVGQIWEFRQLLQKLFLEFWGHSNSTSKFGVDAMFAVF
jgi:hypothetical protein